MAQFIDIGIFYTSVFKLSEWVNGDQSTGRITKMPNQLALNHKINNYTQDHNFIWDEIFIPVTYESDWKTAIKEIQKLANRATTEIRESAEKDFKKLRLKYYLNHQIAKPEVFVKLTDNWITLNLRYLTDVKQRRTTHDKLSRKILEKLSEYKNISIASTSTVVDIASFPDIKIKK